MAAQQRRVDSGEHLRIGRSRARVDGLAHLLDSFVRIPGTGITVGLDSVLGLIPGIGDIAGLLLGSVILYESWRIGAPKPLMVRMLGNIALDTAAGSVPLLGDVFDVAFKAHQRNARLLREHLDSRSPLAVAPQTAASMAPILLGIVALLMVVLVSALIGVGVLVWALLRQG